MTYEIGFQMHCILIPSGEMDRAVSGYHIREVKRFAHVFITMRFDK